MRFFRQDLHTLAGAYALDALDSASEVTRFNRHLTRCQSCASEVRGFHEVATAMAFAATTEPPPEMRDQVLAAVARTRQLAPEIRTHARPRRTRGTAPWLPWLSGAVATAAIAVAVFFGFTQAHTQDELNQARAQNQSLATAQARVEAELTQAKQHDQALAQVLGAPHVTLLSHSTSKGGVAVVVLDAATRKLVVATSGLPALPPGKVYQLWLIGPVKIVSAGLLPSAQAGVTTPVVATGIVKGDKLGLTVEPAGGSKQPTTTPIVALPLPV
ncbi:MAG TPA: anti-sigma factor [Streptosporangiaceae bacterium]|nr:anti-sigma factor [Streptosporangiaceae bacterium]